MWKRLINLYQCLFLIILTLSCIKSDIEIVGTKTDYYDPFVDKDIAQLSKCCPINAALFQTNGTLTCSTTSIGYQHFQIFSTRIITNTTSNNFVDYCDNIECVDFLERGIEWQLVRLENCRIIKIFRQVSVFPKCCPLGYVYDSIDHKCINRNQNFYLFNKSLQVINVSLSHCPLLNSAITDFHGNFHVDYESKRLMIGNNVSFKYGTYCIDQNAFTGEDMVRACVKYEEACEKLKKRCLKKCCPDGEIYILQNGNSLVCSTYYTAPFNVTKIPNFNVSENAYGIITAGNGQKYLAGKQHKFYVDDLGYFHAEENDEWLTLNPKEAIYCVENLKFQELPTLSTFLFLRDSEKAPFSTIKFYLQGVILAISCIFLFITILCYLFLPEMQNVHGKSILMFCIFMFVGCLTLCFQQLHGPNLPRWMCTTIGFIIVFTFLGSFAWLNIICFDMWMVFGTMRVMDLRNKRKDLKKFLYYNLYAWGVPIVICGFALIVYNTECLPKEFIPKIGITKCYFEKIGHSYDYLTFFIIPEATMILINIIFFIKTSVYCFKVKNEIQRMRSVVGNNKESKHKKYQDDKEKLIMLLKLFLVMGISWTFEIISSVVSFKETLATQIIEVICDCINAAEGIIIFCIFILKKKVFLSIKTRLGMTPTRRISEFSSAVTNLSAANASNEQQNEINKH